MAVKTCNKCHEVLVAAADYLKAWALMGALGVTDHG